MDAGGRVATTGGMGVTRRPGLARPIRVETADVTLSGIAAEPVDRPRGLILALHGGGSRAAYFDSPVATESSLVELAAAVGWRSVSLDRPGYGESAWINERRLDTAGQARMLRGALAGLAGDLPVVLVGHSLGSITALQLALSLQREPQDIRLLGVAVGGTPVLYTAAQAASMVAVDTTGALLRRPPGDRRDPGDWLGPVGTWPELLLQRTRELTGNVPSGEFLDARRAPTLVPELFAGIRLPVQFAVAEHESTTAPAHEVLARAAEIIPDVPGTELLLVPGSGHNLSLGNSARSYHLRVLSFAERVLVAGDVHDAGARPHD